MSTASRLVTAMRYRDVAAAVEWLCAAFGFEKLTVASDEKGAVLYAQLTFGNAMLMLAPVRDTTIDQFMKQPDEIGGAETQSCYFVVDDADAHYARAKAAGAAIVLDIEADGSGGRGYSCRDPEGHIWSFGTHDPWQGMHPGHQQLHGAAVGAPGKRRWRVAAGLASAIALAAAAAWTTGALRQPSAVSSTARPIHDQSASDRTAAETEQHARQVAERATQEVREELERERSAKAAAERAGQEAQKRAVEEQRAKEAAERATRETREELERERSAKAAAERAGQEAQKRAVEEQRAKVVAEQAAQEMRDQLERERAAKVAAERAHEDAQKRIATEQSARETAERTAKAAVQRANQDPQERVTEEQRAREAAERAAETAARALEQAQARVADEQKTREAAERAAKEAREQLAREQTAKNAAWRLNAQLRRQLGQAQSASVPGETSADDAAAGATKSAKARPKRQQKAAGPDE